MQAFEPVALAVDKFLVQASFNRYILALSGGMDSRCLLHAVSQRVNKKKILAVYIDHQLQADSALWKYQNEQFCQQLDISFVAYQVDVDTTKASLESEARKSRYRVFRQLIDDSQSCLLTAHHQNDQAETFLLQLFRGSGSKGLSGMPSVSSFSQGAHARPLLRVSRHQIEDYVVYHKLSYVHDKTNFDNNIRRNFVRNQLIPLIKEKWPNVDKQISDACLIQAENQKLLDQLAEMDWLATESNPQHVLELSSVKLLPKERIKNLLRYWLNNNRVKMPNQQVLEQICEQAFLAKDGAHPLIQIQDRSIRRYQNKLYLLVTEKYQQPLQQQWCWDGLTDLKINQYIIIPAQWLRDEFPQLVGQSLAVSLRQGGEKFMPNGKSFHVTVKKYLQHSNVEPWLRELAFIIRYHDDIKAVYIPSI